MAFMLDKLDMEAARRVAQRAIKSVSMTAEDEKLNVWIAFMNLESKFGTDETLQASVRRALEVNDKKKVYLQLINIYRSNDKTEKIEDIYKKLCKKKSRKTMLLSDVNCVTNRFQAIVILNFTWPFSIQETTATSNVIFVPRPSHRIII